MTEEKTGLENRLVVLAAEIVEAYVANNSLPIAELPRLLAGTYQAVNGLSVTSQAQPEDIPVPAVPIRKSVTPDYLICLEDGRKFKALRRHLSTKFGLSPDQYRQKWNLPADYPMVAPAYAAVRSELAKAAGLGRKEKAAPKPEPAPAIKRKKLGLKFG